MSDSNRFAAGSARRACLLTFLLGVGLTGCYRTAELSTPVPSPGTRIVAELTPTGAERMERWIGAEPVGVEARVAEVRPEEWELSLLRVDHRGSPSIQWNGEPVVFPVEVLRGVRERQLDAIRTGAFGVVLGTTLFILARNFMSAQLSDENGGGVDPVH